MGIWRSLLRAILADYGLVGRALAEKVDPDGRPHDVQPTYEREASPPAAVSTVQPALAPGPAHEPIREVMYQVLANNSYWRTIGFGIDAGSAVIDNLQRLKTEYPQVPVRVVDKVTKALIDIRT